MILYVFFIVRDNSVDSYKRDPEAFIFTLKNPHNVHPTKYNKKNNTYEAIYCHPNYGPFFGDDVLVISNKGNKENKCWINNNCGSYECDSKYTRSLFVNTNTNDHNNLFYILDYEVYTH